MSFQVLTNACSADYRIILAAHTRAVPNPPSSRIPRECSQRSGLKFRLSSLLRELVPLASSSDKLDAAIAGAEHLAPGSEDVSAVTKPGGGGREYSDWLACLPQATRSVLAGAVLVNETGNNLRRRLYLTHLDKMNMFIPRYPCSDYIGMMNTT
jgi:hypothetical protein